MEANHRASPLWQRGPRPRIQPQTEKKDTQKKCECVQSSFFFSLFLKEYSMTWHWHCDKDCKQSRLKATEGLCGLCANTGCYI